MEVMVKPHLRFESIVCCEGFYKNVGVSENKKNVKYTIVLRTNFYSERTRGDTISVVES
jgi:hypothetical protein